MIDTYIKKIASITKRGDAREESYYSALAALLEEFSETKRGISKDKIIYPPFVEIKFQIWGHKERKEFIFFYKNYKRPVEILLKDLELEFFTSCVFKNLDKYTGTDIIRRLDLYISNKQDPEAYFFLGKTFNKNAEFDRVAEVFRNLLIIYHCCCGYCQETKEFDRIFEFPDILIR